ncbi:DNA-processing protein DprA [Nocardia asiatica]|uniref:DNA-processing protein DprA n=1 Tax=Nocardia asiatica TaxID=209252 RepID=UPI00030DDD88|nr:DNA-processing protein DprA [Nocardia asiatica]
MIGVLVKGRIRMVEEHVALVALLRARPEGLSWRELTEQVRETGSAARVWDRFFPAQLIPVTDDDQLLRQADVDLQSWHRAGLRFVSVLDTEYPARLLDVVETPPFLFAQGLLDPADEGVSVVGSRKASPRGLKVASTIATHLAEAGLTVISGLAAGIDTAAHTAALAAGGRTVAFIGTGSLRAYPPQNQELQARIAREGLVLSQFWPSAAPSKQSFPMRNALMSGYGLATIVVEAGEHSGARIQARKATEHGRPVILTDHVVAATSWARDLAQRPGVWVAAGTQEVADIIASIRQEPVVMEMAMEKALITLAQGR